MKTVIVFKEELLPVSETFIKAQAEAVTSYEVRYAGILPASPSLVLNRPTVRLVNNLTFCSKIKLFSFRHLGIAPTFLHSLESWAPSLIHAHFLRSGYVAMPLAKQLNVPLVVTLHGYDVTTQRDPVNKTRLFDGAALFLCVSDFIRQKALEAGFPEGKLITHYIGIDCDKFRRIGSVHDSQNVLFVGRMVEKKGVKWLLEAMKVVQESIPSTSLTLIGDGALRPELELRAKQLRLRCVFLGTQSSSRIADYLDKAAVLCLPSVTANDGDSEGLGMTMLEAHALEIPVVATQHGGIPEVIRHGDNGLLSSEGDVKGLATNIIRYLRDPSERSSAGKKGAQLVHRKFNLAKQTAGLEGIYAELISNRRHSR